MSLILITLGVIVLAIPMHVFLRALSARMMTGKWPHQSPESLAIYRSLL